MSQEQSQDTKFLAFCQRVKTQLGEASDEILFAWYFNTFETKPKEPAATGKTPVKDEKK
jgi:hypothetical protein